MSLSDAQERLLIALVDAARSAPPELENVAQGEQQWHSIRKVAGRFSPATTVILQERRLIEVKYLVGDWLARPTQAGIDLCDSMGD